MFSREAAQDFVDGLKAEGWEPNERGEYVCPQDVEMYVRHEPNGEVTFSPKLLEEMKRSMEGRCSPSAP